MASLLFPIPFTLCCSPDDVGTPADGVGAGSREDSSEPSGLSPDGSKEA